VPRKVRLEYEGAVYHVMSRGDKRGRIYADDGDRRAFLLTLGESCERAGAVVYSYVLMGNHYHLLLGTPHGNLVSTMQWLQSTYTARFNARHHQCGHVFAGRYKAIPVQSDEPAYCRIVSDYIHLNPARAKMVYVSGKPELISYPWSSFPALCGCGKLPDWVDGRSVLSWHDWNIGRKKDRLAYRKYLEGRAVEGEEEELIKEFQRGWFFGEAEFRDRLEKVVERSVSEKKRESFEGLAVSHHDQAQAERLLMAGMKVLGIGPLENVIRMRQNDLRKQALAWLVRSRTVVSHGWVLEKLNMGHRSNVTRAMTRFRLGEDKEVRGIKAKMIKCSD